MQNGKVVLGEKLIIFSSQFEQMLKLLLVGDKDDNKLGIYKRKEDMEKECEFVIKLDNNSNSEIVCKKDQYNLNLVENLGAEEPIY